MRAPERLRLFHVVATPSSLDAAIWAEGAIVLRVAPDEALALTGAAPALDDVHAIALWDDGYAGVWLSTEEASEFLASGCEWPARSMRPAFAQGAVSGLPSKLWFDWERVLVLVPAPFAIDLEERLTHQEHRG